MVDDNEEYRVAEDYRKSMNIKAPSVSSITGKLSGGNQQKVVLSKWIFTDPDVLILDEPTRGIDVGAKYEIYTIINQLADQGKAILVISSELPELLGHLRPHLRPVRRTDHRRGRPRRGDPGTPHAVHDPMRTGTGVARMTSIVPPTRAYRFPTPCPQVRHPAGSRDGSRSTSARAASTSPSR